MTWKELAMTLPEFVQWIVQVHGPLPEGTIKQQDYDKFSELYSENQESL